MSLLPSGAQGDPGNYKPVSLTSIPGKQLILESISRIINNTKIIKKSQHGFTKGKSNLINCYSETAGLLDKGAAVDIVYWTSAEPLTTSLIRSS